MGHLDLDIFGRAAKGMKKFRLIFLIVFFVSLSGCSKTQENKTEAVVHNIVLAVQNDSFDFLYSSANKFMSENSGVNIRIMELPGKSDETYRLLSSAFSSEDIALDMFVTEDVWISEFASIGYIRSIDDLVSLDIGAYPPQFSDILYRGGNLYAVPIELDTGIMYYRKDITDGSLGYKQLAGQTDIPYSVKTSDGEDMLCIVRECAAAEGSTEKGLELYKKLYNGSGGKTNDAIDDFRSRRIAYTRSWSKLNNNSCNRFGQLRSKVRVSVPADENGSLMTARLFGVAVRNGLDKEKEGCVSQFLNYLLQEQFQLDIVRELGTLPIQTKYYDMPVVFDYNEYNEKFVSYIGCLQFRPCKEDYMLCSQSAQEAVKAFLNGEIGSEEAARAVNKVMQ